MPTLTGRTIYFKAKHLLTGRSARAAHLHGHSYAVTFYFGNRPDQDTLGVKLKRRYRNLEGAHLHQMFVDSTDEGLAEWFLSNTAKLGCVRVVLVCDSHRVAEAT